MAAGNGWRDGRDPIQRWLRVVTAVVCLVTFAYLAIVDPRGTDVLPTAGLALAALMILLGYEGIVRLPMIGGGRPPEAPPAPPPAPKKEDEP